AIGIIPDFLLQREAGHPALTETVVVETMHERKLQMKLMPCGTVPKMAQHPYSYLQT
ncbi:MAG: hypothetical protein B7X71_15575, partial [Polynucleobacter sp. 39-46-10]